MSAISQFFPSGGSGGSRMDVDVLILSGGGGAAITNANTLSGCVNSGHGGGGAVFQGTIPIEPGSTVPIIIGAGGAGAGPSPNTTNAEGAIGGCSSITFPEGTICVAGGGGGAPACLQIGSFRSFTPLCALQGTHTAGTGGSGGSCIITDDGTCGLVVGPGHTPSPAGEGGRSIYSSGSFTSVSVISNDSVQCYLKAMIFRGTNVQNHKYGQFSGAPASGGVNKTGPTAPAPHRFNSQASGGAGGGGESDAGTFTNGTNVLASFRAGKGVCSNISGTLHEYGKGRVAICQSCWPTCCDGEANYGAGGLAGNGPNGVCNAGSGGSGTVIVRYPTQFAAAPLTPGATNCSPVTPGYYTYRFNSSGSITLP